MEARRRSRELPSSNTSVLMGLDELEDSEGEGGNGHGQALNLSRENSHLVGGISDRGGRWLRRRMSGTRWSLGCGRKSRTGWRSRRGKKISGKG